MKIRKYELVVVGSEEGHCVYCEMATKLLDEHQIGYRFVNYQYFPPFKDEGHLTIPQIYLYNRVSGEYKCMEGGYTALLDHDFHDLKGKLKEVEEEDAL